MVGGAAKFPPIDGLEYLIEFALEVGLYETRWQDIEGWSRVTGITLTPWEANALKRISAAYTGAVGTFEGKDLPQPWHDGKVSNANAIAEATKRTLRQ